MCIHEGKITCPNYQWHQWTNQYCQQVEEVKRYVPNLWWMCILQSWGTNEGNKRRGSEENIKAQIVHVTWLRSAWWTCSLMQIRCQTSYQIKILVGSKWRRHHPMDQNVIHFWKPNSIWEDCWGCFQGMQFTKMLETLGIGWSPFKLSWYLRMYQPSIKHQPSLCRC